MSGGQPLPNAVGGLAWELVRAGRPPVGSLPGPPREFVPMLTEEVMPRLTKLVGQRVQITSRTLSFFGRPESQLMDEIAAVTADLAGVTITSYVQPDAIQCG
ncbi:MAG: hypothetical protein ACLSH6_09955 [Limosilactobacillus pontis]